MASTRFAQLLDLFDRAVGAAPAERQALLDALDDANLREELERMLQADAALANRTHDVANAVGGSLAALEPAAADAGRVGPFELVREIGRGGMGVVYLAQRRDGAVEQRVALKLVAPLPGQADAARRLRVERQILAGLEHPNIARLIDAGEDARGAPYYAMELVEGEPLLAYCDRRALPLRERVGLLLKICDAVRYAHARLVVHRDIKPGNVLVDARDEPRLLDFGIAKTLGDPHLPVAPDVTAEHLRAFSPVAAAPEQVEGRGADSVGCDVYALCALAYTLLSGAPPFDFRGAALATMQQRILHEVPPPMSEAVARRPAPEADAAAHARGLPDARALARALRGDLDVIVARGLRKRPDERFASADALARELERHLAGEPIALRDDDWRYRAGRFLARHRLSVALAAALVLALVAGLVGVALQAQRLEVQRDAALAAQRSAEFQRERAQAVSQFLVGLFDSGNPTVALDPDIGARVLLEQASARMDRELADQPALRAELLETIARSLIGMGARDAARTLLDRARDARATTDRAEDRDLVRNDLLRARLANLDGEFQLAYDLAERALATAAAPARAAERAEALAQRALALFSLDRREAALPEFERAATAFAAALGPDHPETLAVRHRWARTLVALRRREEARALLTDLLERIERTLPAQHPYRATAQVELARVERELGDFDRAAALVDSALEINRATYGPESTTVANTLGSRALVDYFRGDYAAAAVRHAESLAIHRKATGPETLDAMMAEVNLGVVHYLALGDPATARGYLEHATTVARRLWQDLANRNRSSIELEYAAVLADLHDPEAPRLLEALLAAVPDSDVATRGRARAELARVRRRSGAEDEARALVAGAADAVQSVLGDDDLETRRVRAIEAEVSGRSRGPDRRR